MLALQYREFGEPAEVVRPATVETPEPGSGEVLVRVSLAPVHNHDLATIRGIYGVKPSLPAIGGSELCGTVDGKRVAVMTRGAWAEYAVAHPDGLVPIPDGIPDEVAAQLLAMPLSAIVLFDELHVAAGDWIVQNAANGAVGRTLIAAAQKAGVNVLNLVRRESSLPNEVVQTGDWVARVREVTAGAPIVRAIDSVCDENSIALNALLAPGGEHVVFGALAKRALCLNPGTLIYGQTHVRGFWMIKWMTDATAAQKAAVVGRCIGMAMAGELLLPVAGIYPLKNAAEALRAAETAGRPGKVLLTPSA